MTDKQRQIAQMIARSIRNRMGIAKGAELVGITRQNFSYVVNMSTNLKSRNELYCASKGAVQAVIDWYRRTGGILD